MNTTIQERIRALRAWMKQAGVEAFAIPSTDPHLSEYVAPHWQSREWISGFTGSAGTVVVTLEKAGLWTDSRYFLQAANQLEGTGIDLYKEMLPETPSIPAFLCAELQEGQTVGIDGTVFSTEAARSLKEELAAARIAVKSLPDPMDDIWTDRPPLPQAPAFIHEMKYAGRTCAQKLEAVRAEMRRAGAQCLLLSALDEIAWTLNLRGSDVHCNPVVVSYLLIGEQEACYFIEPQKLTSSVRAYLEENGVACLPYADILAHLQELPAGSLMLEPGKTNYAVRSAIPQQCRVIEAASPVALLKAVRNEQEIAGLRQAMQRDGVALVKFLKWLEEAVPQGHETEISIDRKLHEPPSRSTWARASTPSPDTAPTQPSSTTRPRPKRIFLWSPAASCCSTRAHNTWTAPRTLPAPSPWAR